MDTDSAAAIAEDTDILLFKTDNSQTTPIILYLYEEQVCITGKRAKRARHSQVCSIEIGDIYTSPYQKGMIGGDMSPPLKLMIFISADWIIVNKFKICL